jgi:hypothetical protein
MSNTACLGGLAIESAFLKALISLIKGCAIRLLLFTNNAISRMVMYVNFANALFFIF